jgi:hypothetical protein
LCVDRQIDSFGLEPVSCRIRQKGDEMPNIQTHPMTATPSIVPGNVPLLSDDECLHRLAETVRDHDADHLDELAQLIGRLAVTIE